MAVVRPPAKTRDVKREVPVHFLSVPVVVVVVVVVVLMGPPLVNRPCGHAH